MSTVAVVDVGSNAIRLLVATVTSQGEVVDQKMKRYALRLGTDVFERGRLSKETSRALVGVFRDIALVMEELGVDRYRAVGTSAMRESGNGDSVVKSIKRNTGVELEVISGEAESALSRGALLRAIGGPPPSSLIIDLGGGSLELERSFGRGPLSIPFGTVRLLSENPELRNRVSSVELDKIRRRLRGAFTGALGRRSPARVGIGTGGNLTVLSRHLGAHQGLIPSVDLTGLRAFSERVAGLSVEERMSLLGLRADRADLALVATLMVELIVEAYGIETLLVPGTGLREELLYRLSSFELDTFFEEALVAFKPYHHRVSALRARGRIVRDLCGVLWPLHRRHSTLERLLLVSVLVADHRGAVGLDSREWLNSLPSAGRLMMEEDQLRVVAGSVARLKDFDCGTRANWRRWGEGLGADERRTASLLASLVEVATRVSSLGRRRSARLDISGKRAVLDLRLRAGRVEPAAVRRLSNALGHPIVLK